jgi:hypothetical protein
MQSFKDLAALFRQRGVLRFTLFFGGMLAAIIAYGIVFAMLADAVNWPEAYGFTCRRRCSLNYLWHSRKLLEGGTGAEFALFAFIWFTPVVAAAITFPAVIMGRFNRRSERIRPTGED